ncbi:MAG: transcriptional regulator [Thermoproteota archaeon]
MVRKVSRRYRLEGKVLNIIMRSKDGVVQTDLYKMLNISSREGSRICLKLESWGLIKREKVLHKERWTYKLYSTRKVPKIDSLKGSPCFACQHFNRSCSSGSAISPERCELLDKWILTIDVGGADVEVKEAVASREEA